MVCTVSTPVQLLGVGLSGGDAPFTAHLELEEAEYGPAPEDIRSGLDPEASGLALQAYGRIITDSGLFAVSKCSCTELPGQHLKVTCESCLQLML